MRLPKILTFREREVEEPSDNYEAPRDMEELVKKSQHGMSDMATSRATVPSPVTISTTITLIPEFC
jgi:hypothetical protein